MIITRDQLNLRVSEFRKGARETCDISLTSTVDAITDTLNIIQLLTEFNNGDNVSIDRLHKLIVAYAFISEDIIVPSSADSLLYDYFYNLKTHQLDVNYEDLQQTRGFFLDNSVLRKCFIYQYIHEMIASRSILFPEDYVYIRGNNYKLLYSASSKLIGQYLSLRNYLITELIPDTLQRKEVTSRFREYNDAVVKLFEITKYAYFRDYIKE